MTKIVFVTGGVVSGLGKGITSASVGALLEGHGLRVGFMKLDPYLNVDPGTMSPFQHGEVFVTEDGAETDMDLGHYERFTSAKVTRSGSITSGQVYSSVIERERRGDYLGKTVQVIPHVTDEIKNRILAVARPLDVCIVEIGGTVGDIESLPFLEAVRQLRQDKTVKSCSVHLTLIPFLEAANEFKTKPTQHSVQKLREIGVVPDILIVRSKEWVSQDLVEKIALFCSMDESRVFNAKDLPSVYEVPLDYLAMNIDTKILQTLDIPVPDTVSQIQVFADYKRKRSSWSSGGPRVVILGKYPNPNESYKSVVEAVHHAFAELELEPRIKMLDCAKSMGAHKWEPGDCAIIPGGFGSRGIDEIIEMIGAAREFKIPMLGICLGMQLMAIAHARQVLKMQGANSTEFDEATPYPIITQMSSQTSFINKGGTMRLGAYACKLVSGTQAQVSYGEDRVYERHRHRFEFNSKYEEAFRDSGMIVSGVNPDLKLAEVMEYTESPFAVGVQYHPEFQTKPGRPHPLFLNLLKAGSKKHTIVNAASEFVPDPGA